MINRTLIGRIIQGIGYRRLSKEYPNMEVKGLENLLSAKENYDMTTLISSHTNGQDIAVIDRIFHRELNEIPVFIMRNDLQLTLFGKYHLPIDISQKVSIRNGAVPVDQNDPKSMANIMPELKSIYEEGATVVNFSGATRAFGPVNGISEKSVRMYILQLKRNKLADNHGFIPCGIVYDSQNPYVSFGDSLAVTEHQPKDLAYAMVSGIAQLTGTTLDNLAPAETVLEHIKNRTRNREGIKTVDPRILHPRNLARIVQDYLL